MGDTANETGYKIPSGPATPAGTSIRSLEMQELFSGLQSVYSLKHQSERVSELQARCQQQNSTLATLVQNIKHLQLQLQTSQQRQQLLESEVATTGALQQQVASLKAQLQDTQKKLVECKGSNHTIEQEVTAARNTQQQQHCQIQDARAQIQKLTTSLTHASQREDESFRQSRELDQKTASLETELAAMEASLVKFAVEGGMAITRCVVVEEEKGHTSQLLVDLQLAADARETDLKAALDSCTQQLQATTMSTHQFQQALEQSQNQLRVTHHQLQQQGVQSRKVAEEKADLESELKVSRQHQHVLTDEQQQQENEKQQLLAVSVCGVY